LAAKKGTDPFFLLQADNDYIDRCERNNLDFEIIYLEEKDLAISGSLNGQRWLDGPWALH
jgi:hypothetical protein